MRPLLALAMLLSPSIAAAQGPRHGIAYLPEEEGVISERATGAPGEMGLAFAGLLGAGVGVLGGGFVGARLEQAAVGRCYDYCGLAGFVVGATLGTTIAVPVTVHAANGRRGDLSRALGWSGFVAAAGWGLGLMLDDATPVLLIPAAQVIVSVGIETRTGRRPAR